MHEQQEGGVLVRVGFAPGLLKKQRDGNEGTLRHTFGKMCPMKIVNACQYSFYYANVFLLPTLSLFITVA